MKSWLVTVGEPLPIDSGFDRLHRSGTLASYLVDRGHTVTWWTSDFDHIKRVNRFGTDRSVSHGDKLTLQVLHGGGYRKNISLARILDHRRLARRFLELAPKEPPPDIIVASLPTLALCRAAAEYGRERRIPVLVDVRDLWPDIFIELLPRGLRWAGRIALHPLFRSAQRACAAATAITGPTPAFVDWGLRMAGRTATANDCDFAFGYSSVPPPPDQIAEAERYWDALGIRKDVAKFRICFFGTLSHQFEIEAVIEAARTLHRGGHAIRFILCGDGDLLPRFKALAADLPDTVLFPGWINAARILTLMRRSNVGLAPYRDSVNFTNHIPNKILEYLSAGLPIVSTLQGTLRTLLNQERCGITYGHRDAQALAAGILELSKAPDRCREMGHGALRLFRQRFDADAVYNAMVRHLESLADSARTLRT